MKFYSFLLSVIWLPLMLASCTADTASPDLETEQAIGVFVENTGTGNLILRDVIVSFCYEGSGCVEGTVANYTLPADAGAPIDLGVSDTGTPVSGVAVILQVATGQGSAKVREGSPTDNGFESDTILKVVEFGAGESVSFQYGETEF